MELLKKISPRHMLGENVKDFFEDTLEKTESDLFNIFGIVKGIKTGESNFGPWTALVGSIEAINLLTGEHFASSQCFLPEPMNGLIVDQLHGSEVNSVEFAVTVGIKKSSTPIGYEFTCKPLVDPKENDQLSALRSIAMEGIVTPALEAPKSEQKESKKKKG